MPGPKQEGTTTNQKHSIGNCIEQQQYSKRFSAKADCTLACHAGPASHDASTPASGQKLRNTRTACTLAFRATAGMQH